RAVEDYRTVQATAAGEVSDTGRIAQIVARPFPQHGQQRRLVGIVGSAAADEDVLAGAGFQAVLPKAADRKSGAVTADQRLVAGAADEDVTTLSAFKAVVAGAAI